MIGPTIDDASGALPGGKRFTRVQPGPDVMC